MNSYPLTTFYYSESLKLTQYCWAFNYQNESKALWNAYKITGPIPNISYFWKMRNYFKLYALLFFDLSLATGPYCLTSELTLPAHGKGWKCDGPSNVRVERNVRCTAVCEKYYHLVYCKLDKTESIWTIKNHVFSWTRASISNMQKFGGLWSMEESQKLQS